MLDADMRRVLDLTSNKEDEKIIKEIMEILCKQGLTVDRASRVLKDARKMLPYMAKLEIVDSYVKGICDKRDLRSAYAQTAESKKRGTNLNEWIEAYQGKPCAQSVQRVRLHPDKPSPPVIYKMVAHLLYGRRGSWTSEEVKRGWKRKN